MFEKSLIQTMLEDFAKILADHRKVQSEIFQEIKISMLDSINRIQKTIDHMVEVTSDIRSTEEKVGDTNVQRPSRRCVSLKKPANSALKLGRARTVPVKHKRYASLVRKPRKNNSSKFRYSAASTQPQKQGTLARAPSIPWRFQVSDHALDGAMEKISFGGDGGKGKHPFDRGKVQIMGKLFSMIGMNFGDKVLLEGGVLIGSWPRMG
ncbi:hypothetical protein Bca4012_024857 [Brassica carinata]